MKKEQWAILLAFLMGCVLTNFLGKDILTAYGILNEYFLKQYSYRVIDGNRLFCYILMERGRMAVIVFLFGRVLPGNVFSLLAKSIAAAEMGVLLTVAVVNLGVRGLLICPAAMFPQWLFYFGVLLYYANCKKKEATGWVQGRYADGVGERVIYGMLIFLGMSMGVFTECYVNPFFFTYVLKIL